MIDKSIVIKVGMIVGTDWDQFPYYKDHPEARVQSSKDSKIITTIDEETERVTFHTGGFDMIPTLYTHYVLITDPLNNPVIKDLPPKPKSRFELINHD